VNLLTKTEQFDDAYWVNNATSIAANTTSTTDPRGGNTADKLIESSTTAVHFNNSSTTLTASWVSGVSYKFSIYCKKAERDYAQLFLPNAPFPDSGRSAIFNLASGTVSFAESGVVTSITNAGNGWYLCSITVTADATTTTGGLGIALNTDGTTISQSYTGDGTSGIFIWGADLRVANDGVGLPAYQSVNTATDYDTVGFPVYLRADGSNDYMLTNSIDFTGTDKVTVAAGVRKLSDAATGILTELSVASGVNNGTFVVTAPFSNTVEYSVQSRGNAASTFQQRLEIDNAAFVAPVTNVITGIFSIPDDISSARINGVSQGTATGDQGTGNYGNYPLYLFSRAGTSLFFNGRFYGSVGRGAQSNDQQIAALEGYMNTKTAAY
jgi:hypothetical protein